MWLESITPPYHLLLSFDAPLHFRKIDMTTKKSGGFIRSPRIIQWGGGQGWCHEAFWFISQGPDFSHIWKFFRNIANNMSFLFRPIWKKPTNQHRAEEWKERWMDRPYIIGITQLLRGFKKIFKTNLGLKGPIIFGRIGTNMVKQEFFWIKKTIFCIWCAYGPH